jgi:Domain of unknown function (DUF6471)
MGRVHLLAGDGLYPFLEEFPGLRSEEKAKNLLKAELKRRGVGYRELAEKLTVMGVPETERNIANKVSRGGFTAAFLVQCFEAIGATEISVRQ